MFVIGVENVSVTVLTVGRLCQQRRSSANRKPACLYHLFSCRGTLNSFEGLTSCVCINVTLMLKLASQPPFPLISSTESITPGPGYKHTVINVRISDPGTSPDLW